MNGVAAPNSGRPTGAHRRARYVAVGISSSGRRMPPRALPASSVAMRSGVRDPSRCAAGAARGRRRPSSGAARERGVVHGRVAERVGDAAAPVGLVEARAGVAVRCARDLPHPEPLGVDARDLREVRALELAVDDHDRCRGVGADGGAHAHRQDALLGARCACLPHREEEAVEDPLGRVDRVEVRGEAHRRLRSTGGDAAAAPEARRAGRPRGRGRATVGREGAARLG